MHKKTPLLRKVFDANFRSNYEFCADQVHLINYVLQTLAKCYFQYPIHTVNGVKLKANSS